MIIDMPRIQDLENLISWFENKYSVEFAPSEMYALFPKEGEYGWRRDVPYPNSEKAGVYAFFDENLELVYIGKAKCFGRRFGSYFGYDENWGCMIRDSRVQDARYIKNYATPEGEEYMALALEEFLIAGLNPKDNTMSRTQW